MIVELFLTTAVTLTIYVYLFCKSRYAYFKNKGVKNLPVVPFFGNMKDAFLGIRNLVYIFDDIYNAFPSERIIGFYEIFKPTFMVRDPELIKQITVKDFDHFVDHRAFVSEETDQIFANSLLSLKGDKWRDMRSTLSPAFTGSKIRNMCPFIVECAQQAVEYLKKECYKQKSTDGPSVELELKDLYTRLGTDVIATSAFGVKVNSLEDKKNEFFITGIKMSAFTTMQILKIQIVMALPKIAKYLKIRVFHPSVTEFFKNIFVSTVKYREENNIVRPDMINILMEVKKGSLKYETQETSDNVGFATVEESEVGKTQTNRVWADNELASQAFLFFLAGFDTVSTVLSFTSMELVLNSEVQDKLREEVDAHYPENGILTYEALQKMTYLDMVVSEGMRLWAPGPSLDRLCVKKYRVPDKFGGKTDLTIEKGSVVVIPAQAIHCDPKYWENPKQFNPERFSNENKHKILPFTYLPFGSGPRNCIGSRFALMEAKVILYYLVRNFKLVKTAKTMNPMRLSKNAIALKLENGFWLKFVPRDDFN